MGADTINTALNGGTSVTLDTSMATGPEGAGDIIQNAGANIDKTAGGEATLTLNADNQITLNADIRSSSNALNVIFNAGGDIDTGNGTIDSNGGNITLTGNTDNVGTGSLTVRGNLIADGGNIQLEGRGADFGTSQYGIFVESGSTISTTGNGILSLTGMGGNSDRENSGLHLEGTLRSQDGNIELTGVGNGAQDANYGIYLRNGSLVETTGSGDILIDSLSNGRGSNNDGLNIEFSRVRATGEGNISILTRNTTNARFVSEGLWMPGTTISTTSGDITIHSTNFSTLGTAGLGLSGSTISTGDGNITLTGISAGSNRPGLALNGNVVSTGGNITLTGEGGEGGSNNYGIHLFSDRTVSTTGNGSLSLNGTAGTGTNNSHGIFLNGTVRSENGAIDLTAPLESSGNDVHLGKTSTIESTGGGDITVTANDFALESGATIASSGVLRLQPIALTDNLSLDEQDFAEFPEGFSQIAIGRSDGSGLVSLSGDLTFNDPVTVESPLGDGTIDTTGATLSTNGDAIALTAAAGINSGTIDSNGGDITAIADADNQGGGALDLQGDITADGGNIQLGGGGGNESRNNDGIRIPNGVTVATIGKGNITAIGIGGNAVANNVGIEIGGLVSVESGNITLDGTGGNGTGGGNRGIAIDGGEIEVTEVGDITLNGTGGNGTQRSQGISIENTAIRASGGDINLTGTGGKSTISGSNRGIVLQNESIVETTGAGNVTLMGTGGTGPGSSAGIVLNGTDTRITVENGTIDLTGTSLSRGRGIRFENDASIASNRGDVNLSALNTSIDTSNGTIGSNGGNITVNANALTTSDLDSGGGDISLTATNTGITTAAIDTDGGNLTIDSQGTATVNGSIAAANVTSNPDGTTVLGGDVTTTGNQTYGNVTLNDSIALNTGRSVQFNGSVGGSVNSGLTVDANRISANANIQVGRSGLSFNSASTVHITGNTTALGAIAIAAPGNLTTGHLTTPGNPISLTSQSGQIATGNLTSASTSTNGGNIALDAETAIVTGAIDSDSTTGRGGNVALNSGGDVEVTSINTRGGGEGGNVFAQTERNFRATGTFIDRNGQTTSISTAGGTDGGTITLQHGGNGEIPFIVGNADTNGTVGAISRGTAAESTISSGEFPFTHTQDAETIQIISIPDPNPQPLSDEVDETSIVPSVPEVSDKNNENLSLLDPPSTPPSETPSETPSDPPPVEVFPILSESESPSDPPPVEVFPILPESESPSDPPPVEASPVEVPTIVSPANPLSEVSAIELPPIASEIELPFELRSDNTDRGNRTAESLPRDLLAFEGNALSGKGVLSSGDSQLREIDTQPILSTDLGASGVADSASNSSNSSIASSGSSSNSSSSGSRAEIFADNDLEGTVWRIEQFYNQAFEEHLGFRADLPPQDIALDSMQETLRTLQNEAIDLQAAVIYAIAQTDGLELILLLPEGQPRRYSIPEANRAALFPVIREFRTQLTHPRHLGTTRYQASAQQLHDWIIAPLEADLEALSIDTLMFSMDEGLRSLPIAALHDGTEFLVEKYSLSLIPSFALMDARYEPISESRVLAMGASQFSDKNPLIAVPVELEAISNQLWTGKSFLNEAFTVDNLLSQRHTDRFEILHLATHAEFQSGSAENSYIQLWDDRLQLDELPGLNFQDPPVNLLVLSACQTALGDREAELGFGGLALQSGAQTVLASLWSVSDKGTLGLMSAFYSSLDEASIKAEALQQAQIAMLRGEVRSERGQLVFPGGTIVLPPQLDVLEDLDLTHPYFWSGFTAIGSPW